MIVINICVPRNTRLALRILQVVFRLTALGLFTCHPTTYFCSEFLIHAADVEGLCQGIDEELVKSESMTHDLVTRAIILPALRQSLETGFEYRQRMPGGLEVQWSNLSYKMVLIICHTYYLDISDLDLVQQLSNGRVDLTYGRWAHTHWTDVTRHSSSRSIFSALDIFGGSLVKFLELVERNRRVLT